ncbi:potassium channel family protein [Natranaerobius thermophilus]|uniref:TrkA-N domain protein n=1 Tax=Natranaerobius thermophilus (strain ATCC BAA-1301 / DSM 18059 / JW/NM-WN-LF) TaxID=457570 RepID=B2A4T0_NATTJ|nr:TrkA family potassium uptake protein [Natranaerobius thermophilus]ACB83852.1 TrkA-N domain protein [Natranaerobius thermophilus JW/NM-WN-LF]
MKNSNDYIIIVGCGRLGSSLANNLSISNKSVVVIDWKEKAFNNLSEEFSGFTMEANVIEKETLMNAKADQADVLVAVTNDDNTNIMVAEIAKSIYEIPNVIARLYDPARKRTYEELDIKTISSYDLVSKAFTDLILSK